MSTFKIDNNMTAGTITNTCTEEESLLATNNNLVLPNTATDDADSSTQVIKSEISVNFENIESQPSIKEGLSSKLAGLGNLIMGKMLELIGEGSSADGILRLCLLMEQEPSVPKEYKTLLNDIITSSLSNNLLGSIAKFMASGGSLDGSIRLALLSQNLEIKANFDSFLQTLKPNEIQNLVKDLILALTENPIDEKGIKELTSSILSQIISDPGKLLLLINKLTPAQLDSLVESLPDLKATVEMLTNTLKADSPEKTDGTVKLLQSMLQNNIPLKELLNSNPQLLNLLTGSNINNLMKLESSQDDTELVANISAMLNSAKKEQKETNLKINILLGKFINKKSIQGQSANKQPTAEDNDTESES